MKYPREPDEMIEKPAPAIAPAPEPPSTLGGWMAFTLFVGAARADANAAQLAQLREHVVPAIQGLKRRDMDREQLRTTLGVVLYKVQAIMGRDWVPTGEYMTAINKLTGKEQ